MPDLEKEKLSEYEKIREKNIEVRKALFRQMNFDGFKEKPSKKYLRINPKSSPNLPPLQG